jgi:hypothetical protein
MTNRGVPGAAVRSCSSATMAAWLDSDRGLSSEWKCTTRTASVSNRDLRTSSAAPSGGKGRPLASTADRQGESGLGTCTNVWPGWADARRPGWFTSTCAP